MVKTIDANGFENEAKKGMAVVDFSATWCGPCKMLAPVLEEISEEMADVNFYKIDVDDNTDLAVKYGISNIPALLVLKDGEKQDLLVGFRPKDAIADDIKKYL